MEFFNKSRTIRLRSHLDKYLLAEDDEETVRQSRNESTKKVIWTVEFVEDNSHVIRLKSSSGRYLTASESEEPLLLGMTGKKVMQTSLPTKFINKASAALIEWEPIREGFQVKMRTRNGSFLRGNGATKPWRNTVTHDRPTSNSTQNWILWDVVLVDSSELERSFADYESQLSSFSSLSESYMDSPTSPWSVESTLSPVKLPTQRGMEFFNTAKAVRLKGHHDKYLVAEEDEESVSQDRNGSSKTAKWSVEFIQGGTFIRLKSCFGKYLTASNSPFLLGMTGRKVTQSLPSRLDSSLEWEPVRDGALVKLKTRYGNYLRANGGLPPWRNSVTHDVPHRTATQEWVLWNVDILELQVHSPKPKVKESVPPPSSHTPLPVEDPKLEKHFSRLESSDSFGNYGNSFPKKVDGRLIYYSVADDNGNVDDGIQEESFNFKGNGVEELTQKLEEETGLDGIVVCTRSPLNGKLYPLRLHLPPNNSTMHVVVVQSASRVARSFTNPDAL